MEDQAIREISRQRQEAIDKELLKALSKKEALRQGLKPVTHSMSVRRWDCAKIALKILAEIRQTGAHRKAAWVINGKESVEVWALPPQKLNL